MFKDRKVIVIAVDGGTFDLLGPLLNEGKMPNFKKIIEGGASGKLRSIYPPLTPPAFASFATGKNPGKTGIYNFLNIDPQTTRFRPVNSKMRRGPAIWDLVGNAGGKVVVMNIPVTYPPPNDVKGILITDFLTPFGQTDYGSPLEELNELEQKFGKYPIHLKYAGMTLVLKLDENIFSDFMNGCFLELDYKFQVLSYLRQKHSPNLVAMHLYANDQISHHLWQVLDKTHPLHNEKDETRYKGRIVEYYSALDNKLGQLVSSIDDKTLLIVMSDHGFGPAHKNLCVDTWLLNQGFIVLKKTPMTYVKKFLWNAGMTQEFLYSHFRKMIYRRFKNLTEGQQRREELSVATRKRIFLSLNDVDWSKSQAFPGFLYDLYVNSKTKLAKGSVEFQDYANVRDKIVHGLQELKDPDTRKEIGAEILTLEEAFKGNDLSIAPDLIYLPIESNYSPVSRLFMSRKVTTTAWLQPGNHRMDGILSTYGKGVAVGKTCTNSNLIDLAPTILYFLGVPIPKDMDGKVLVQPFEESFLLENQPEFFDGKEQTDETDVAIYTQEEEQQVMEHLRQLGYAD